jgi:hypothetical protein
MSIFLNMTATVLLMGLGSLFYTYIQKVVGLAALVARHALQLAQL